MLLGWFILLAGCSSSTNHYTTLSPNEVLVLGPIKPNESAVRVLRLPSLLLSDAGLESSSGCECVRVRVLRDRALIEITASNDSLTGKDSMPQSIETRVSVTNRKGATFQFKVAFVCVSS